MSALPLNRFPSGTRVTITALQAGTGARGHLCALGLTPGTLVEITSCGPGPCRLRIRDTDLLLGHGMAEKVLASKN